MGWKKPFGRSKVTPTGPGRVLTVIPIEHHVSASRDASAFAGWLYANLMTDPDALLGYRESVEFVWEGYETDPRELWEIPEVVAFVADLNERWPCALYFLSREGNALKVMTFCLLGANLVTNHGDGRAVSSVNSAALAQLLDESWLPTINKIAGLAGLPDVTVEQMSASAERYFTRAR